MDSFEARAAVITGGANGIGFACAQEFARRGARIMLADIDQTSLDAAVATLRGDGVDAHGVLCDVRKLDDVTRLADEAFGVFGEVHLVFNNAGIAYAGPIAQASHEDWRFVIDVDLWGPIHGVEAFLPRLITQDADSHIAFTSSFAGLIPNVGLGPYCVAKYGVVALAETLSREVRADGIGVTVLCPMIVETNLLTNTERVRSEDYGPPTPSPASTVAQLASAPGDDSVLNVDDVARLTADAILANRLYVLPHRASRESIQRRFARIDRTFEDQIAQGWTH
ncbi:SDR family NAD(P)-dependent oxidoreductase [Mycolicibacterium elephantis]|uniref:Short-chain dehydrogenase n=1 Tax=Mycolicibacterium elephantis DSM 44368 TaxID=1335622 RepID=A0A439DTM3_9MYCO|nr:SDR family NAD(P)-dependent oxidoreductase [Mycolicibacterium elephantis]MCV7224282.1 SDR family NAD(P)-dependent oxidoreductase [Mycolicibacterium elephantis]RWA19811.1 short-chain dehydrogenase [Mycolicibacterium elephantis DSM 44368]